MTSHSIELRVQIRRLVECNNNHTHTVGLESTHKVEDSPSQLVSSAAGSIHLRCEEQTREQYLPDACRCQGLCTDLCNIVICGCGCGETYVRSRESANFGLPTKEFSLNAIDLF